MWDYRQDREERALEPDQDREGVGPTPGRRTLTAQLAPSSRAIARQVIAMLRGEDGRDANGVGPGAARAVERAASDPGMALSADTAARFGQSLGVDLSGVRVHTGASSAEAAHALGARAYTIGQDVHFGAGHYHPGTPEGEALLAHEVAHTVQQGPSGGPPQGKLEVSTPGDHAEVEADRAADAMVRGQATQVGAGAHGAARAVVMRSEPPGGAPEAATGGVQFEEGYSGKLELAEFKGFKTKLGPLEVEGKASIEAGYSVAPAKAGGAKEGEAGTTVGVNQLASEKKVGIELEVKHKLGELGAGIGLEADGGVELTSEGIRVGAGLVMTGSMGAAKVTFEPVHLDIVSWKHGEKPKIATASVNATITVPVIETEIDGLKAKIDVTLKVGVEFSPDWGKVAAWLGEKALEVLGSEVVLAAGLIAGGAAAVANAFIGMAHKYDAADLVDGAKIRALNYAEAFEAVLKGTPMPAGPGAPEGFAAGMNWLLSQTKIIALGGEGALEAALQGKSLAMNWHKAWPQCQALAIQKWKEDHSDSGQDWEIFMATLTAAGRGDSRDPRKFGPGRSWD